MKEIKFYNIPRTDVMIKNEMNTRVSAGIARADPSLVAYYPLDDGIGFLAHDLSRFCAPATHRFCEWSKEKKSDKTNESDLTQTLDKVLTSINQTGTKEANEASNSTADFSSTNNEDNTEEEEDRLYTFSPSAIANAVIYTNGDAISIIYPPSSARTQFPSLAQVGSDDSLHAVSILSCETGYLLEECEYRLPTKNLPAETKQPAASSTPSSGLGAPFGSSQTASRPMSSLSNDWASGPFGSSSSGSRGGLWDDDDGGFGSSARQALPSRPAQAASASSTSANPNVLLAATMSDAESGVWIISSSETDNFSFHTMRPPIKIAQWRREAIERQQALSGKQAETKEEGVALGTVRQLQQKYEIPSHGTVPLPTVIMQLFLALEQSLDEIGSPSRNCPSSLSYLWQLIYPSLSFLIYLP